MATENPAAPVRSEYLQRQDSPWRERRFIVDCLARLLRSRFAGPVTGVDADDVDWQVVATEAARHGVAPLLRRAFGGCPEGCPPQTWRGLCEQYDQTARRNAMSVLRLNELLGALAEAGLDPPILLKGLALMHTVYPTMALRPMQDLDLLVNPPQRIAVAAVLEGLKYRQICPVAPSNWHARVLEESPQQLAFVWGSGQSSLLLECHLRVLEWPQTSFQQLYSFSLPIGGDDAPARVPHPADELLLLVLHLWRHQQPQVGGAGRLIWWFDLAARLQAMEPYQDAFAQRLGHLPEATATAVLEITDTVQNIFGGETRFLPQLPRDNALSEKCAHSIWQTGGPTLPDVTWLTDLVAVSPLLSSPLARARFVSGYLLPPPSYVRRQFGLASTASVALWYARRPLSLAVKLARLLLRR